MLQVLCSDKKVLISKIAFKENYCPLHYVMRRLQQSRKISTEDIKKSQGLFWRLSSDTGSKIDVDEDSPVPNSFWTIVEEEDTYLVDSDTGDVILILCKNRLPSDAIQVAYDVLKPVAKSNSNSNRGIAGGYLDMQKIRTARPNFKVGKQSDFRVYPMLKEGQIGKTHYCNPVSSSIVGWTDIPKRDEKHVKCRLTAFSANQFQKFSKTFPFFESIDKVYKEEAPDHYGRQKEFSDGTVALVGNTIFSTITVNYLFRSALHQDAGDYKGGLGAFAVTQTGSGGELLFPEYGVAARVCTGDVLLFNSHLWHCTAPVQSKDRLTFVCYLRIKVPQNCPKKTGEGEMMR